MSQLKRQDTGRKMIVWVTALLVLGVLGILAFLNYQQQTQAKDSPEKPYRFSYANHPALGDAKAPVRIVEFADFKCPVCREWEETIFPQLKKDYIDTGKVRFYYMNYLVIPGSGTAALVGRSVYAQSNDAFWQYYQAVYRIQGDERTDWATLPVLMQLVRNNVPWIDIRKLQQDVEQQKYWGDVEADKAQGNQAGVSGTPTLFVDGYPVASPFDYTALQSRIQKELTRTP
jgi:protein-disulfide isomerase